MTEANYNYLNGLIGYDPFDTKLVDIDNIWIWRYFSRSLYHRLLSGTDFRIPENWRRFGYDYFRNVLYCMGYIGVINTDEYGVIPQIASISGYGLYYQPTDIVVGQPLVNFKGRIGENCELIRITPDYIGVWDIINHYTHILTELYLSVRVSAMNVRSTVILNATTKAEHDTLVEISRRIAKGVSIIIHDKFSNKDKSADSLMNKGDNDRIWKFAANAREQYIISDLLGDIERVIQEFDREIGIAALGEKKERRISDEVEMIVSDSNARPETWKDCLVQTMTNVNKLFNLSLGFFMKYGGTEYSFNMEGGEDNGV